MKTKIFKSICFFTALSMCVSLSSCSDDDNDDNGQDGKDDITSVFIDYTVNLGNDFYDFYDIDVSYVILGGEVRTERISTDWSFTSDLNGVIPFGLYSLKVTAKPKASHPEIDPSKVYRFDTDIHFTVFGRKADGSVAGTKHTKDLVSDLGCPGSRLEQYLNRGERELFNHSYQYDKPE